MEILEIVPQFVNVHNDIDASLVFGMRFEEVVNYGSVG
jgi:hypothetical protein